MILTQNVWLHRFSLLVAGVTLFLVIAGASVTSTGSGLAVPDWPLSFGQFFPPMEGGVFYEHGHRMIAGVVLVLMLVLTVWLYKKDDRVWVRRLALVGMLSLVLQALLGGLTVLLKLPTQVSVSHAALAMAFFSLTVSVALFTSPGWMRAQADKRVAAGASLSRLALITTAAIYLQILVGAVMRHTGAGLAIPDFPLSYGRIFPPYVSTPIMINYAHRVGALIVTVCVVFLIARIMRGHRGELDLYRPALLLSLVVVVQLLLGALTIWTRRSVVPTTAHVAVGAATLGVTLVIALRSYRWRLR